MKIIELNDTVVEWLSVVGIIIVLVCVIFAVIKTREYFDNQPKSRPYMFARSVNQSTKWDKIPADEPKCVDSDREGGCYEYETTIYFSNEDEVYLDCIPSSGHATLICSGDDDNKWEIEKSGDRTKEKYYSDGALAH